jgi:hypothetical protein
MGFIYKHKSVIEKDSTAAYLCIRQWKMEQSKNPGFKIIYAAFRQLKNHRIFLWISIIYRIKKIQKAEARPKR